jgi:hypothetical protein
MSSSPNSRPGQAFTTKKDDFVYQKAMSMGKLETAGNHKETYTRIPGPFTTGGSTPGLTPAEHRELKKTVGVLLFEQGDRTVFIYYGPDEALLWDKEWAEIVRGYREEADPSRKSPQTEQHSNKGSISQV